MRARTLIIGLVASSLFASTAFAAENDKDGDGFATTAQSGHTADCDDNNADIHPDANEIVGNGVDDDCDPATPDTAAAGAPATCPDGQHEVTSTKCEKDAPVVDAEAKACADLGGNTLRFYTSVHAACVAAGANCTWYGATETDPAKKCHGIEAPGYTWAGGKIVSIGEAARAQAQAASAAAAAASRQVGAVKKDLATEVAARKAAVEGLKAEIAGIQVELDGKADKADLTALATRAAAAQSKLDELTQRVGGPGGLEAVQDQLIEAQVVLEARMYALEDRTTALEAAPKPYIAVSATVGGGAQNPAIAQIDQDTQRTARGTGLGSGTLDAVVGVRLTHWTFGVWGGAGVTLEGSQDPDGERKTRAGSVGRFGLAFSRDVGGLFSVGLAVGAQHHTTAGSVTGWSRVQEWSAIARPEVHIGQGRVFGTFGAELTAGQLGYNVDTSDGFIPVTGTSIGGRIFAGAGFQF